MQLSVLIPSRNEEFLKNTIEDIIKHAEAETEIITVLDGAWAEPPISQHPMVNIIYVPEAIGQRAATTAAAKLARGKYLAKVDAHCTFDQGFDRKMIEGFEEMGDDNVMVPIMRNLHAFDWKCYQCGKRTYQDAKPEKCDDCGCTDNFKKKMVWQPRKGTWQMSYCFDKDPHFQYFKEYKNHPQYKKDEPTKFTETMSLQGSFFMMTKELYFSLYGDREKYGSWGNEGIEIAAKAWLSGRRVIVNHNTWYGHMFRTKKDFSFPYPQSGREVVKTKNRIKEEIWNKGFKEQIYPISWLVERFIPVPGWKEEDLSILKDTEFKPTV